jgi:imidazolonepropionase-like amidohydrolase
VIAAPDAAPIRDGAVVIADGKVIAVGSRAQVPPPAGAEIIDAHGATITAAFWNAHVHFLEPRWQGADTAPVALLADRLRDEFTRWGFAHVVDTGSRLEQTVALRHRIEGGELVGPSIRTAGPAYVAVGGQPIYLPFKLPELATPEAARAAVTQTLDGGADLIKLMTASVVAHPPPPVMPVEVVRAAVAAAHARGALVFSHPTNLAGVEAARDGGVDVLAHTEPQDGPWTPALVKSLIDAGVSLVPTLSLWRPELAKAPPKIADRFEDTAVGQVHDFAAAGGVLLFGTDVGYRPEYDPTPEHRLLARAGLSFAARLAMLTTAPARRFGVATTGRLAPGMDADLVVLDGDPVTDPAVFARVRCTFRRGVVLYAAMTGACGRHATALSPHR